MSMRNCDPLLQYGVALLLDAFRRMGVFHRPDERHDATALFRQLGIIAEYERLFGALLRMLERAQCLRSVNGIFETTDAVAAWPKADAITIGPDFTAHADCLRMCVPAYPEILTGRRSHVEVLFPKGSLSQVQAIYKDDSAADACGRQMAQFIASCAREHHAVHPGVPFRVLEAGAGTGATSLLVLKELAALPGPVEFLYTDLSPTFLEHGRRTCGEAYPFASFEKLDLEHAPAAQGFHEGSIDLIFACNVIHATRNIAETLANLKWLLRPQGILSLIEVTRAHDFATLLFGLTSGWWRYQDEAIRIADSPLLTPESWQRSLASAGFGSVVELSEDPSSQWSVLAAESEPAPKPQPASPPSNVIEEIRAAFAEVLRIPPARIRPESSFDQFGVDSLVALELNKRLERTFGPLPASLLFEHTTVAKLAAFLSSQAAPTPAPAPQPVKHTTEPIAIIGLSGRYPQADTPAQLWQNLRDGKDCIRPFPKDRLNDLPPSASAATETYGGFLDRIDSFDAPFFGIAPAEADFMDPQERLWLETAWHAIEDAGYTRAHLETQRAAVFVGCMYSQYPLAASDPAVAARLSAGGHWSIANRTSFLLRLNGPSLAIDTACSSSLTAVHMACESLRRGECEIALAGGVNLTIHPGKLEALRGAGMLADGAQCKAFGQGTGLLPGEGAGAVLLKPLSKAQADGDHIHALVLGSAVNHNARTSAFRVPNPEAQAALIQQALQQAGVDAASLSYIEAAANGSPLGDPLEIAGVHRALNGAPVRMGSVKSNLGHLEAASGISQLTKVIGQLRDGVLYPSIYSEPRNPDLGLERTAIQLVTQAEPWIANTPRRAGISSFGAGGANAHLIVEEYAATPAPDRAQPEVILLSARNEDQLQTLAAQLADAADQSSAPLADIAFTLSTGREFFAERLALVATSKGDLVRQLRAPSTAMRGSLSIGTPDLSDLLSGPAGDAFLNTVRDQKDWARAARLWLAGVDINWTSWIAQGRQLRRTPLPGYPFEQRRCWLPTQLHPLLHRRIDEHRFSATFTGTETVFAQHHVNGAPVMPAAALIEMARAAIDIATNGACPQPSFRRLAWTQPLRPGSVEIHLTPQASAIDFTIRAEGAEIASGTALLQPAPAPHWDASRCDNPTSAAAIYEAFAKAGLQLGPHFRSLAALHKDGQHVRARLYLQQPMQGCLWQPGLLDGILQTLAGVRQDASLEVPYWINSLSAYNTPDPEAHVQTHHGADGTYEILVSNPDGQPALALQGVQTRRLEAAVNVTQQLTSIAAGILRLSAAEIPLDKPFPDYGFDSQSLVLFARRISEALHIDVSPAELFARPTIAQLAARLQQHAPQLQSPPKPAPHDEPIAIIGMAAQFPGSPTLDAFWQNLQNAEDLIAEVPGDRWDWRELGSDTTARWGGFLPSVDLFDPLFFGISPREAAMMDPQQRLFLESVWHAIEDAGYAPSKLAGTRTALYVGVATSDYADLIRSNASAVESQMATGIAHSVLANRISYLLDLHGPSQPIDTACSSALVAIHHAVEAIRHGGCEMAIAGGVNVILSPVPAIGFAKAGFMSPGGRCRAFGEHADGYVRGEGVGAILLKPLSKALADGDNIRAVIRSAAVNHGGRSASLTAPSAEAQAQLLRDAWQQAGVDPASIGYIEAHGTGTPLGDPIEVLGMQEAFGKTPRQFPCRIGSVKSNFGHLEAAAGIAGVIKTALALQHAAIPPTLHADTLNPHLPLAGGVLEIASKPAPWPYLPGQPMRGGVSSFGFGGANAHVVIEAPPARTTTATALGTHTALLTARTKDQLREAARQLSQHLSQHPELALADVCYTLWHGHNHMDVRWAARVSSIDELRHALDGVTEPVAANDLQPPTQGRRIPLPGYPFARQSHWFKPKARQVILNPTDPRIADHKVGGKLICAGAILIEEALHLSRPGESLKTWTWERPIVLDQDPITVNIRRNGNQLLAESNGAPVAKGELHTTPFAPARLQPPTPTTAISAANLYSIFATEGLHYGPWFQGIHSLQAPNAHEAWAQFTLPARDTQGVPGADLIDIAMQAASFLHIRQSETGLPYRIHGLQWTAIPTTGWIHITGSRIEITDHQGNLAITAESIEFRPVPTEPTLDCKAITWHPSSPAPTDFTHHYTAPPNAETLDAVADFLDYLKALSPADPHRLLVTTNRQHNPIHAGIAGLALAAGREHPHWTVHIDDAQPTLSPLPPANPQSYRHRGVYLITGAYGTIGQSLARHLALTAQARLILISRRQPGPNEQPFLTHLRELGAEVLTLAADIADPHAIATALQHYGTIHGVFHAAMHMENRMLPETDRESLARVCAPKFNGTRNLCEALANTPLDFLCVFSSIASITGSVGQSNYVAANALQDAIALLATHLPIRIINWGYWENGGNEQTRLLMERMGIDPIRPRDAFPWLRAHLADPNAPRQVLVERRSAPTKPRRKQQPQDESQTVANLQRILSAMLAIPANDIDATTPLERFGVDSIVTLEFSQALAADYGQVTPAEIFEHRTLSQLAAFLCEAPAAKPSELLLLARGTRNATPISYWIHGAPGYAQVFRPLARDAEAAVYAFQARGIDGIAHPFTDFAAMADHYCALMERETPGQPVILGGYSLGGALAMEVARRWHQRGYPVERLVLLDTYPNTDTVERMFATLRDQGFYLIMLANMFLASRGYAATAITITEADLAGIPPAERMRALARMVSQRNNHAISEEDVYLALKGTAAVSNAFGEAFRRFEHQPYDCSEVLFLKAARGFALPDEGPFTELLAAFRNYDYIDPWRSLIRAPLTVHTIDCDHFSLLAPEHAAEVRRLAIMAPAGAHAKGAR